MPEWTTSHDELFNDWVTVREIMSWDDEVIGPGKGSWLANQLREKRLIRMFGTDDNSSATTFYYRSLESFIADLIIRLLTEASPSIFEQIQPPKPLDEFERRCCLLFNKYVFTSMESYLYGEISTRGYDCNSLESEFFNRQGE